MSELTAAAAAKLRDEARGTKTLKELREYVDREVTTHSNIGLSHFDLLHAEVYPAEAYEELIAALKKDGYSVTTLVPGVSRITW